ncbi:MAG: hypothetical protein JWQ34_3559 [Mucilaginibacter sp.]|uniref:DUF4397 domain-containing protein n=1 Tax=Mucilaginibacter sp. TaxID=1882438 RepID=UPI00262F0064|nr:DUF4397 domain-containing protein [Mucilaginibacter sp.]MDB5005334.1 hypothetical protein [Mucilaginibacter sp.]
MNIRTILFFLAVVTIGLSACTKTDGDLVVTNKSTSLSVINASADTLNFYQNGTRLNNNSNLYPFGLLSNLPVTVGLQNFQFKKAGSPNALVDAPNTIKADSTYTLIFAGETTDKVFLLTDHYVTIGNTASIRFVNASSTVGGLDVTIGDSISYKNRTFKSATPFVKVAAGKKLLSIYKTGSTTPLIKPGDLTLVAGSSYTLYTKGDLNGTGNNAFGARILISTQY